MWSERTRWAARCAVAIGALIALCVPTWIGASAKGDLSGDSVIDVADLPILARHLAGLATLSPDQQQAADVSPDGGDGSVDSADLLRLARHLLLGADVDGDGLLGEVWSSPFMADTDGDALCDGGPVAGLCTGGEAALGTAAANADTDADGLCDGPLRAQPVPTPTGTCQGGEDLDASGSSTSETSPTLADTDADGLCDGPDHGDLVVPGSGPVPVAVICTRGEDLNADTSLSAGETDPKDPDFDDNLVLDGDETDSDGDGRSDRSETLYETLALDPDTDNDGICDGSSTATLSDPNGPGCSGGEDPNGNGTVEFAETDPRNDDTDGDLLADGAERSLGSDPRNTDSDGDHVGDGAEVANGTSPVATDTDGDGLADGVEPAFGFDPLDPQSGEPDGYGSLRSYGGDAHVHSGTPWSAYSQSLPGYDPNCTDCPAVWCDRMYAFARAAGHDWVVSTNHDWGAGMRMSQALLDWWKTAPVDYSHPAHPQDVYPTHPDGFPLYDGSGGHTDDLIESLTSCAEGATVDGSFVGFFGIEYTAAAADTDPAPEQPDDRDYCTDDRNNWEVGCGGHKTVIYSRLRDKNAGEKSCTQVENDGSYDDQCETLGELYDTVRAVDGIVNIAHPNAYGPPGLDLFETIETTPPTPPTDNGGIAPDVVLGAEARLTEMTPQPVYTGGDSGLNYGGLLARGYRLHPIFGSDVHFRPFATSWQGQAFMAGECWATGLTRGAVMDGMRAHRCYWARERAQVRLTIENEIMGGSMPSDEVDPQQGIRVRLFALGISATSGFTRWSLMRGTAQDPPVAPANILPSAIANCDPSGAPQQLCVDDVLITLPGATTGADYEGFYYVILQRQTTQVAVTAPVWIDPPAAP